jgi:outer membrane protein assembly factor BamE (lipoprotein component of BamABCDE complex)
MDRRALFMRLGPLAGVGLQSLKYMAAMIAVLFFIFAGLIFYTGGAESFCFFNPWIDTETAPGFSEKTFDSLRGGMSTNDVMAKLGQPLWVDQEGQFSAWQYTCDGKCTWGDWAWMSRSVTFSNNLVIRAEKRIYYD